MKTDTDVLLIGGGIIGISAAYYLIQQGLKVTLVEQGKLASGCSGASTGLIVPSYSIPLAVPGALGKGLNWMLKSDSPFYIKPRLNPSLYKWLRKFRKYCNLQQMYRGLCILRDLSKASLELFTQLIARESLDCDYRQDGWLVIYRTDEGYKKAINEARLLRFYGIDLKILNAYEILDIEPMLRRRIHGGIYFKEDAHLDPVRFIVTLAKSIRAQGGIISEGTEVVDFEKMNGIVTKVITNKGDIRPKKIILTTGAWSNYLVKKFGLSFSIQPGKGYSISTELPEICSKVPFYFDESKVTVTPMKNELRFAGTLELVGMDFTVNPRRTAAIMNTAASYLRGIRGLKINKVKSGLRSCTPDGLPIIDRLPNLDNLFISAGHSMMGITLAPITGKLITQLVCEKTPEMDLAPFRITRFN